MDNRDQSSVANSMCDLLAYHDTLATPTPQGGGENSTTENTTENLLTLLKQNVKDTCAWVRSRAALSVTRV